MNYTASENPLVYIILLQLFLYNKGIDGGAKLILLYYCCSMYIN